MKFEAYIEIPMSDGRVFLLEHRTDDRQEAYQWLARKVGRNPASEFYGINDRYEHKVVHQAGVVEAEMDCQLEAMA